MLNFLPGPLIGIIATSLLVLNILFWVLILLFFSALKLLLPFKAFRPPLDRILLPIAEAWISCNSAWMALTQKTIWDVDGIDGMNYRSWYLVNCNHQSWVDILLSIT